MDQTTTKYSQCFSVVKVMVIGKPLVLPGPERDSNERKTWFHFGGLISAVQHSSWMLHWTLGDKGFCQLHSEGRTQGWFTPGLAVALKNGRFYLVNLHIFWHRKTPCNFPSCKFVKHVLGIWLATNSWVVIRLPTSSRLGKSWLIQREGLPAYALAWTRCQIQLPQALLLGRLISNIMIRFYRTSSMLLVTDWMIFVPELKNPNVCP